jgi:hypothetical protein
MKSIWLITLMIIVFLISSCNSLSSNSPISTTGETAAVDTPASIVKTTFPLLKTSMGDFIVVSTRLVDEAHENKAPSGSTFLLIGLARPDLQKIVAGEFSFESFQSMASGSDTEIYILGSDGSKTDYGGMGGWLDNNEPVADDFVMGFLVPLAETYTLYWSNNTPILLSIEQ